MDSGQSGLRFGVVVFPGSNCDRDCDDVVGRLLGQSSVFIWHEAVELPPVDVVILPGGFSYGDALRAGAIARFSPVMQAVSAHAARGGFVLGICNGFQILVEVGLLPGAFRRNRSMKFICKPVSIRVENADRPFTSFYAAGQVLSMPIAHAEGNYYIDPPDLLRLQNNGQILFRYCAPDGTRTDNPNGSVDDIAGICNEAGNILGMMPHPERASDPGLGGAGSGGTDGLRVFESLIGHLR